MGFKVITPPTEPVTLAEARLHLRVTDTSEDALITSLITAARIYCEHYTQRAIGSQTLELALDEFPDGSIELPMSPVTAITSVKYIDEAGTEQTISSANYTLDDYSHTHWVVPAVNYVWPMPICGANVVKVRYVAGAATTPAPVLAAMKLIVGHLFENREQSIVGLTINELPMGVMSLLDTYRIWSK